MRDQEPGARRLAHGHVLEHEHERHDHRAGGSPGVDDVSARRGARVHDARPATSGPSTVAPTSTVRPASPKTADIEADLDRAQADLDAADRDLSQGSTEATTDPRG